MKTLTRQEVIDKLIEYKVRTMLTTGYSAIKEVVEEGWTSYQLAGDDKLEREYQEAFRINIRIDG